MSIKGQSEELLGKKRRARQSILFWLFTLSAVPLTALVVTVAAGYHFDSATRTLVPSSAIMIETTPKEVVITLNADTIKTKTPLIRKIDPGDYTVTISQEGYLTWEKYLEFTENKSLIFPSVVLFPDTEPLRSQDQEPRKSSIPQLTPLRENLASTYREAGWEDPSVLQLLEGPIDLLVDTQQSAAFFLKNANTFTDDDRIDLAISDAEWNDDRILLYLSENELWIYDHRTGQHTLLKRQSLPILDATWHPSGGYILYGDDEGLYAIELDDRDSRQTWQLNTLPKAQNLSITSKGESVTFESAGVYYEQPLE